MCLRCCFVSLSRIIKIELMIVIPMKSVEESIEV